MTTASTDTTVEGVRDVLVRVLEIEDRAGEIDADTPLLGQLPELDSLAVAGEPLRHRGRRRGVHR
jgi:acyl carrier protein